MDDEMIKVPAWVQHMIERFCSHGHMVVTSPGGIYKGQLVHRTGGIPCDAPEPLGPLYMHNPDSSSDEPDKVKVSVPRSDGSTDTYLVRRGKRSLAQLSEGDNPESRNDG